MEEAAMLVAEGMEEVETEAINLPIIEHLLIISFQKRVLFGILFHFQ